MIKKFAVLMCMSLSTLVAAETPVAVSGPDVIAGVTYTAESSPKGLVVVFLSAKCPCSKSHVPELEQLANEYKEFNFVGIHSNQDESADLAKKYFAEVTLPFPVIRDADLKIADRFKAAKTPHAFIVDASGKTVFQGGMSDSKDCGKADRKYLREALSDMQAGKAPRESSVRTVGCTISRKKRG